MSVQRYIVTETNWNHLKHLRPIDPIICKGYNIIGYYPYEKARFNGHLVRVPATVFASLKEECNSFIDNKIVVICEDTYSFGSNNFAVFFHDGTACIGEWSDIGPY